MTTHSFYSELIYNDKRVATKVILETPVSKEIRILMKQGQAMPQHKAPFPIIVQLLEGSIEFGVEGVIYLLQKGDILSLEANVPHDLLAHEDSMIRLSLSKQDSIQRVESVTQS